MFLIYIVGLYCLALSVGQCQATYDLRDPNRRDEIRNIFESLEKKSDDQLLNSWFPIGMKILNKVGEISKNDYENEVEFKKSKFPLKRKFNLKTVCKSKQCFEAGLLIRSNLNESVDPCEDFYEFACGGWINNNQIPSTSSHYSQFDLVEKTLMLQLKDILEAEPDVSDPLPTQAAQVAYKTCTDSETIERQGVEPLVSILNSLGGWPIITLDWSPAQFDPTKLYVELIRRWNIPHLFQIFINEDRMNSTRNIITVDQGTPLLPRSMLVEPGSYVKQIEAYTQWITRAARALAVDITNSSGLEHDAREIVKFEMRFAKLTSPPEMRRDATRLQHLMSIAHLTEWTDSASRSDQSKIDWMTIVSDLFNGTGMAILDKEVVNVKELDYLFRLVLLIEETPPNVLANYLVWRIVQTLSYEMTDNLRKLGYDFEHVYTGSTVSKPRWHDCVDTINDLLGFAVGYKYVKLHFNEQHKKELETLTTNMKVILKSRLSSLSWMDSETRSAAVEKLEAMKEFIGYPAWYSNVTYFNEYFSGISVSQDNHLYNLESLHTYNYLKSLKSLRKTNSKDEWPISPAVVNAYNDIQRNTIIFPAGILQPPFFSLSRPESLNYGSIGIVIGHEIMHGFDDMGRQNDKFGNIVQWWSHQTLQTYKSKADCFVQQYSRYRIPELDSTLNEPVTANGVATQGENIADNGGLEMGYLAYKKFLIERGGPEQRLPGLEKYSPEQLFFIGYANNWCESVSMESLLEDYLSGVHSIHRLRVIGALSNSEHFAKAFSCKTGSPMNPSDKCSIW